MPKLLHINSILPVVCTRAANDPARKEALKKESFSKRSSKRARVAAKAQGRSTESEWASDRTESASHVEPSQRFVPRRGRKDVDCENPIVCTYKFAHYSLIAADEGRPDTVGTHRHRDR